MVPVRCDVVVFAATLKVCVPLPDPVVAPVSVIQLALLNELHEQPAAVVTDTEPLPEDAGIDCEAGATV
jgi:hypothetical protein